MIGTAKYHHPFLLLLLNAFEQSASLMVLLCHKTYAPSLLERLHLKCVLWGQALTAVFEILLYVTGSGNMSLKSGTHQTSHILDCIGHWQRGDECKTYYVRVTEIKGSILICLVYISVTVQFPTVLIIAWCIGKLYFRRV